MRQTTRSALFAIAFYAIHSFALAAQETTTAQEKPAVTNTTGEMENSATVKDKPADNKKVLQQNREKQNMDKLKNEKPKIDPQKTTLKDSQKKGKNIDGDILKNQALIDEFKESYFDNTPTDRLVTNMFYGFITGGLMGFAGGLSFYTTATNLTPFYISAGAVGLTGAVAGAIIALVENSTRNPLLGNDLLKFTWYGVIGGAMIGAVSGLLPYSSTGNMTTLLNWTGYGVYAGIGVGVALFLILPKSSLNHVTLSTNAERTVLCYNYRF